MQHWRSFWHTVTFMGQENPPQLVETLMLALSMVLFSVWIARSQDAFLVLGLVFTVGACSSILVREAFIATTHPRPTQIAAAMLLVISLFGFADLLLTKVV